MIPFNKPFLTGKETHYIQQAVSSGKISGNGLFTKKCQEFFEQTYGFKKTLLTTSCTDALEMCAMLIDVKPNDEIIVPSFTFVSTALAFVRQGAKIIFADSSADHPNMDADSIEALITPRTKAIVVVHYAGVACDMDKIMALSKRHQLVVIEDAAQAIDSFYKGKPLGTIGHLSAFSFHETKNIISGEGGMLAINDKRYIHRAEIIWEKGTNRAEFFRGEVNKYGWKDIGSSFLPSEIISAFLWAQLENLTKIQEKRKHLWNLYHTLLQPITSRGIQLPQIPPFGSNNAHMFYLICESLEQRNTIINKLKEHQVLAVFHYLTLHNSEFYESKYEGKPLIHAERYSDCLVRLPFFFELEDDQVKHICDLILA